jgi:site-specific recombinase XerD
MHTFDELKRVWLASCASANTRRSYNKALDDMQAVVAKPFDVITRADAERFAAHLREQGLTESTVNLRLAACSSFYDYGIERYTTVVNGRERGAFEFNPFSRVKRAKVQKYGKSLPLETEQVRRLLDQPDRSTERGARDYAMLLFAILTSRRANEICQLRWRDIDEGFYQWRGKGGVERRDTLPEPVWAAIENYIQLSGHSIVPDDPVFTSERYIHKALSTNWFNSMVKQYAGQAELPAWVHTHTLRHTAASLRRLSGGDILEISRLLAHSSVRTTQIYVNTMLAEDSGWLAAWKLIENSSKVPAQIPVFIPEGARGAAVGNAVGPLVAG